MKFLLCWQVNLQGSLFSCGPGGVHNSSRFNFEQNVQGNNPSTNGAAFLNGKTSGKLEPQKKK